MVCTPVWCTGRWAGSLDAAAPGIARRLPAMSRQVDVTARAREANVPFKIRMLQAPLGRLTTRLSSLAGRNRIIRSSRGYNSSLPFRYFLNLTACDMCGMLSTFVSCRRGTHRNYLRARVRELSGKCYLILQFFIRRCYFASAIDKQITVKYITIGWQLIKYVMTIN